MWKWYAILSAVFAALTAIFAKIGIKNVDSNVATAIRTCVILFITWGIVLAGNEIGSIKTLTKANWIFLILSGVATGLSWLFYFKALQLGNASKVGTDRQNECRIHDISFFHYIERTCKLESHIRSVINSGRFAGDINR